MRQVAFHVVCEHGADLEFWFSSAIADMIHGWQQMEFSLVKPTSILRFFVIPLAQQLPI